MTMIQERPAEVDPHDEAEAELDPEGTGRPPRLPRRRERDGDRPARGADLSHLLLIVLALVVAAVAVFAWQRGTSLADERDDRREAAQVASDFTTAIQGYDSRDLSATLDAATALATRDYGSQLSDAWFSDLQPIVEQLRARATVDVSEVLLGEISQDAVSAVVNFNADIRSTVGTRRLAGAYLRLDLLKVNGDWKVDDMTFLATSDQTMDANGQSGATPPQGGN